MVIVMMAEKKKHDWVSKYFHQYVSCTEGKLCTGIIGFYDFHGNSGMGISKTVTNKSQNEVVVKFKIPFIAMEYVYMN